METPDIEENYPEESKKVAGTESGKDGKFYRKVDIVVDNNNKVEFDNTKDKIPNIITE